MSSKHSPYTFVNVSNEPIVTENKPTDNRSGVISKPIRLGLGYGVVGLVIGYGASALPVIRFTIMLAGRPPEDIDGWFMLLLSVSLFAVPAGIISMIIFGIMGAVIGRLIYRE